MNDNCLNLCFLIIEVSNLEAGIFIRQNDDILDQAVRARRSIMPSKCLVWSKCPLYLSLFTIVYIRLSLSPLILPWNCEEQENVREKRGFWRKRQLAILVLKHMIADYERWMYVWFCRQWLNTGCTLIFCDCDYYNRNLFFISCPNPWNQQFQLPERRNNPSNFTGLTICNDNYNTFILGIAVHSIQDYIQYIPDNVCYMWIQM